MAQEKVIKKPTKEMLSTELIHCALVGDGGVGKSFLARSRACGTKYELKDMFQLHISTVWTYDNYRTTPEVKKRSFCQVDGVNCTLKICDTFGNREIKRENVYSLADVIIICFSAGSLSSLQNVTKFWIKEVKEKCPGVPVILCACKVDLRYTCKDPKFMEYQKTSFTQRIYENNMVYSEAGKEVAKQIGACYYETSSLVSYGIDDLFNNSIRAVLVAKRRGPFSFAFSSYKNVSFPHIQVPHSPPKPVAPKVISEKRDNSNWLGRGRKNWLSSGDFCDVKIILGSQYFEAHRVFLAAASPLFEKVFLDEEVNSEKNAKISPCVCKKNKSYFASNNVSIVESEFPCDDSNENKMYNKSCGRFLVTKINNEIINKTSLRKVNTSSNVFNSNSILDSNMSSYCSSPNEPSSQMENLKTNLSEYSTDSGGEFDFNSVASTQFDQGGGKNLTDLESVSENMNGLRIIPSHHHINADDYYSTVNGDSGIKPPLKTKDKTASVKILNNPSPRRLSAFSIYRKLDKNSCSLCKKFKNSNMNSVSTISSSLSLAMSPILSINRHVSSDLGLDVMYNLTKTYNDIFEIELDDKIINSSALKSLLSILYSGQYDDCENFELENVLETAKILKFTDVVLNLSKKIDKISSSLETVKISTDKETNNESQIDKIRHLFLENDRLTDVCFDLDDGQIFAHRSLLSMHCDVFTAMFTSNFYERQNKCVDFRSASRSAFKTVQEYLYTGLCPTTSEDWLGALELAKRLCLDDLLLPLQRSLKDCLDNRVKNKLDVILFVFRTLKLSRLIEIEALAKWCLWFLTVEFEKVAKNYKDELESLSTEDKEYVEQNRWPPEWYLKAMKGYNREILEMSRMRSEWVAHPGGCFAFNLSKKKY